MLINFLVVGITGVFLGCFFRLRAIIVSSLLLLGYAAYIVHDWSAARAIAVTFALLASMQGGYILGLAISSLAHKVFVRLRKIRLDRLHRARDPQKGSPEQPLL